MTRFEETGIAMGDPDADLDALLEEQAALQAKIEDADAWNLQVGQTAHCSQPAFRGVLYAGLGRVGRYGHFLMWRQNCFLSSTTRTKGLGLCFPPLLAHSLTHQPSPVQRKSIDPTPNLGRCPQRPAPPAPSRSA